MCSLIHFKLNSYFKRVYPSSQRFIFAFLEIEFINMLVLVSNSFWTYWHDIIVWNDWSSNQCNLRKTKKIISINSENSKRDWKQITFCIIFDGFCKRQRSSVSKKRTSISKYFNNHITLFWNDKHAVWWCWPCWFSSVLKSIAEVRVNRLSPSQLNRIFSCDCIFSSKEGS